MGVASKENQPTHITREASEKFQIDAEVIAPQTENPVKIYRTELPELDDDQVNSFLQALGEKPVTMGENIEDNIFSITGTTESNKEFDCKRTVKTNNYALYSVGYSDIYDPDKVLPWSICLTAINPDEPYYLLASPEWNNMDQYSQPRDLNCVAMDEAKQILSDILEALQIQTEVSYNTTLYLDYKTMDEVYHSDYMKNHYGMLRSEIPRMDTLTEDDDRLYLGFHWVIDEIPICTHGVISSTEIFAGANGRAYFSSKGLDNLLLGWPYYPVEELEEVSVLSATEACDIAEELLGGLVDRERTLLRISLEYYATQDGDRWILKPIWEFTVWVKEYGRLSDNTTWDELEYYHIDAVTGEEI